ncbi:glutamate--cysteine ligase [Actinoplanes sp. NPDC049599]|uniref:glutamate--cysteine ligase n=1 Tax=Actinoplanes sp. NPDC049599 TaxID=3363903 RepID=UPI0037980C22
MRPVTFGVEEEFLLLDPVHGRPVPAAPKMLRLLHGQPWPHAELMRFQFETVTRVCDSAGELRGELTRLRRLSAEAARSCGCRLVASGVSPYGVPGLAALTDVPRYRELARRNPALTALSGTCGCHVHVGMPSRDLGVRVLARLRPWLATLLALSANSPLENAHDTGWASRRYSVVTLWPTARPPSVWDAAAAYDRAIHGLLARGAALDERSVYLLARLSPRFPTVEIRVPDVCPDVDTAVLVAVLIRALVATEARAASAGSPVCHPSRQAIRRGLEAAARHGLAGPAIDPFTGDPVDPWTMVSRLVTHSGNALDAFGDGGTVAQLLELLAARGTGAQRQRAAWGRAQSPAALIAELAATTAGRPAGAETEQTSTPAHADR